jgi:hypothetical protein
MNVCVMDDITVDLINSSTGNITFNQVCGCPGGKCICYMAEDAINEINSISGQIDISQNCSNCATFNQDPRNSQPSNCSGSNPNPPNPPTPPSEQWWEKVLDWIEKNWKWEVLGLTIFVILIIVILLI